MTHLYASATRPLGDRGHPSLAQESQSRARASLHIQNESSIITDLFRAIFLVFFLLQIVTSAEKTPGHRDNNIIH